MSRYVMEGDGQSGSSPGTATVLLQQKRGSRSMPMSLPRPTRNILSCPWLAFLIIRNCYQRDLPLHRLRSRRLSFAMTPRRSSTKLFVMDVDPRWNFSGGLASLANGITGRKTTRGTKSVYRNPLKPANSGWQAGWPGCFPV